MAEPELDPRWDWADVRSLSDPGPVWIKIRCHHQELESVTSTVTGQEIARLCLICDSQLPPAQDPPMFGGGHHER